MTDESILPISFPSSRLGGECRSTVMSAKSVANVSGTGTERLSNLPSITTRRGLTTPGLDQSRQAGLWPSGYVRALLDRLPRCEGGNTAKSAGVRQPSSGYTVPDNMALAPLHRCQSNLALVDATSINLYIEHANPVPLSMSMKRERSKIHAHIRHKARSLTQGCQCASTLARVTVNSIVENKDPRDGKGEI